MQTEAAAFLTLFIFGCVLLCPSVRVDAAPKASFSPRRLNGSAARKASSRPTSPSEHVTRVQLEDLDNAAASADCIRLRQLDLCDRARSSRSPIALSYESKPRPVHQRALFSLLDSPSCRRFLRPFLCVALATNCSLSGDEAAPAALPPCRTMCLAAAEGCLGALGARGIDWPTEWTCERFPVEGLCLDQPPRHDAGLKTGPNGRDGASVSETPAIESRGSLQPPPSSAFDNELLLALPAESEDATLFRGWADVQGLGQANDYCRIIGTNSEDRMLSCAINGTAEGDQQTYTSKRGFDSGLPRTGFMRDVDGDKRDDYCRCVGNSKRSQLVCMKAGERGFYGGTLQPGSQYTIRIQGEPFYATHCHHRSNDVLKY